MIDPQHIQATADAIGAGTNIMNQLVTFIPSVIGVSSVFAAMMPAPEGNSFLSKVHKFINLIAFNFAHAKNKDESRHKSGIRHNQGCN